MNKNYYYILGINTNVSSDEIKKAYRKLSYKFHPDKNDGDKFYEERFREIHEAYETLIDDKKRRFYDLNNIKEEPKNEFFYKNFEEEIKSEYEKIKKEKEKLKKEKEAFEKEKQGYKTANDKNNRIKSDEENIPISKRNHRPEKNYLAYGLAGIFTIVILTFFIIIYINKRDNSNKHKLSKNKIENSDEGSIISEVGKNDTGAKKVEQMILVEGGEFEMGGNANFLDERPKHNVALKSFYIDKYEVTIIQFKRFVDEINYKTEAELAGYNYIFDNNYYFAKKTGVNWRHDEYGNLINIHSADSLRPVIRINWIDASEFCKWAGKRLPTEAEWEYAASGGNLSNNYTYSGSNNLNEIANYGSGKISRVGSLKPNELGIYDMTGNLYEWCNDFYDFDYYKESPTNNPTGPLKGNLLVWSREQNINLPVQGETNQFRVYRGGSCFYYQEDLRIKNRGRTYFNENAIKTIMGFRCVKDI